MREYKVAEPQFEGNEARYVLDAVQKRQWAQGPYVREFELKLEEELGVQHVVSCANGTAALHLALLGLGLKSGDEVIIPSLTYVATANAVSYCGATPVLVDVDRDTWCLDMRHVKQRITPRTRGIIPVHLYGAAANIPELLDLAKENNLWIVEDAAEALGGHFRDQPLGTFGNAGTFSFYGNKTVVCGEGGAVATNSEELARKLKLYRGQGVSTTHRYYHEVVGYNYRLSNLHAALGLAQLEGLTYQRISRAALFYNYQRIFSEFPQLTFQKDLLGTNHARWMFVLVFPEQFNRDEVARRLAEVGIETRPTFVPMHRLPMYLADKNDFPISEWLYKQGLCLPTHGGLANADAVYISAQVLNVIERLAYNGLRARS